MEVLEFKKHPYGFLDFESIAGLSNAIKTRASDKNGLRNSQVTDQSEEFQFENPSSRFHPEGPASKVTRRSRRGEGSLKIDNNYFSKYNEMFHKELEQNNPDSLHYVMYNKICSRQLVFKGKLDSPIENAEGFPEVFEFTTKYIKLLVGIKGSTLSVRSTPYHEFKSHLLATLNLHEHEDKLSLLRAELQLTNLTGSKSLDSLLSDGCYVKFKVNTRTSAVECVLTYDLYLGTEMNQFLNSKVIDKICKVVNANMQVLGWAEEISTVSKNNIAAPDLSDLDNTEIPPNAQLFYDAMIRNALAQKDLSLLFELPELETNLLNFQARTVNWLLSKESVEYNTETNRCQPKPLLSESFLQLCQQRIESFFSFDDFNSHTDDHLEGQIFCFLNSICFGWQRILFHERVFWFNKYNANLFTNHYIYKYVLNYFRNENTPKVSPGQGLLAEEMGLGKTVEVTALILLNPIPAHQIDKTIDVQLKDHGDLKPVLKTKTTLIIAPDSILKQWVEELLKLAPSLAVTVYKGIGKYPQFGNNARLISDYLRMFDIVFTSYSVISKELDYAVYSSRNNLTRAASRKRKNVDLDNDDDNDDEKNEDEDDMDGQGTDSVDNNNGYSLHSATQSLAFSATLDKDEDKEFSEKYRELFQISLSVRRPKIANQKSDQNQDTTDFEKALQDELSLALKHNKLPDMYHNNEYKSPLMFLQFWRVILDEVQMVSSQVSRAFKSAALIPRYHSWGVSGTPIKKNLQDLHSVLSFLKYQPFSRANGKFCWDVLTNININTNDDFIKLWSSIGLRHTKAMVEDDIKLPPQRRMLMTIPFNAVEQENYNQILGDFLSTVCLDVNGNPVFDDWEPTPTILTYMRNWLTRLRQVCCNPQIGHLSQSFRRNRARQNMNSGKAVKVVEALKTLDHVLDDMLAKASDDIITSERKLVQVYVDLAQLYEFIRCPRNAQFHFHKASLICQEIIARTNQMIDNTVEHLSQIKRKIGQADDSEVKQETNDEPNLLDDDDENEPEGKSSSNGRPVSMTDYDYRESQRLEELINTYRIRLRAWDILLHKCYFLLGSSYFQLYDEEYSKKVTENPFIEFDSVDKSLLASYDHKIVTRMLLGTEVDCTNFRSESFFEQSFNPEFVDLDSGDSLEVFRAKHQERCYYVEAEAIRQRLLKGSIANVEKAVESRIKNREFFASSKPNSENLLVDDGSLFLPKSTKKFFKDLPIIQISDLEETVLGIKAKLFFNRVNSLVTQLNNQAIVINEWMGELIKILCMPLLSFEKDPNGEEYEKSIEEQDKASCYLHLVNKMLIDRIEAINGKESSTKIVSAQKQQQDQRDFEMEMDRINDKSFLNNLEQQRKSVKPVSKASFQDLLYEVRDIESDLKDEERIGSTSANLERKLLYEMGERIRGIYDNQKLAQVLLQKEVSVNCNAVFNARIDYFKQLQQISDSVKMPNYNFDIDFLHFHRVELILTTLCQYVQEDVAKLSKFVTKFKYLQTLTKNQQVQDDTGTGDEDDFLCIICRTEITIGSLTSCGHKYCKDCLEHWFRNSRRSCPMCKAYIAESGIYNFTRYKPNLKASNAVNGATSIESTKASKPDDNNLFSIYRQIDDIGLGEIMSIELKHSYSSKVDMIVKQVLYLRNKDPKVQIVVFSQWHDLLYILSVAFRDMNISYLASYGTLNGSGNAGRPRSRYDAVEEFKNSENGITCFLLNAKAQASGLTLINATHIFLCEPLVNTSLELQAISRIHRIGQTKMTTVWMFAIENTVEESIVLLSTNKRLNYVENSSSLDSTGNGNILSSMSNKISRARELSRAESMTLLKSEGIDRLVNRASGDGESVSNSDLWDAFFCATSTREMSQTMNLETMSKMN